jgi:hypothetical protein
MEWKVTAECIVAPIVRVKPGFRRWPIERRRCGMEYLHEKPHSVRPSSRSKGRQTNGLDETKKRCKEKRKKGSISRQKKTHNRPLAKICTDRTGEESLVCR